MSMGAATSPLLEAAEGVRSGRVPSEELVTQALKRLEETDGDVGAFLSVQGRSAVEAAKEIDRKVLYCTRWLLLLARMVRRQLLPSFFGGFLHTGMA